MTSDRIRLAQFGVGRWGHHLLRNFLVLPSVEMVAVVEPNTTIHPRLIEQFGESLAPRLTTDADSVLSHPLVDAIVIATPAATHYSLIKTALDQGKHVMAEKPLTLQVEECKTLCALAKQRHRQLIIDHTYLFHPVVRAGHDFLASAPLGTLRYGYATRTNLGPVRPDVDALWDLAIHDIAIFNHWLGELPEAVAAHGQVWLQSDRTIPPHFPLGLADVVWLRLFYPSGFQANIHVCWANPDKQRRIGIVGDRGTLLFDEMTPQTPLVVQQGTFQPQGDYFVPIGLEQEKLSVIPAEPLKQVCEHFIQCIQTQQPSSISSGETATHLVEILSALSQSLNQGGQPVQVRIH